MEIPLTLCALWVVITHAGNIFLSRMIHVASCAIMQTRALLEKCGSPLIIMSQDDILREISWYLEESVPFSIDTRMSIYQVRSIIIGN